MRELSVRELGDVLGGDLATRGARDGDLRINDVSVHSDRLRRGSAFFALRGGRVDGHDFVARALSNGAVAAVVARDRAEALAGAAGPLIVVDDPLDALQRLAAWWRGQLGCAVVAVIGANGKTITKDALVYFAGLGAYVVGSPGSYNSQLGVALSVLSFPTDCDVAVVEAAAVEPGSMARLERIVRPTAVVCTNLGVRYESFFPDRRSRAAELLTMARNVGPGGWLLIGEPDPDLEALSGELSACPVHVLGREGRAPLAFSSAVQDFGAMTTTAVFPDGERSRLRVTHPSRAVLDDVELALTAAWLLDPAVGDELGGSIEYQPTSPETTVWQSPEGVTIVREPATADPIALTAGLRTARSLVRDGGRLVVVLADPLEGASPESARPLGDALADDPPDDVVALTVATHEGIVERLRERLPAGAPRLDVSLYESLPSLQADLLAELGYGDVVLVQSPRTGADPVAHLVDRMAPTRMHVDLTAIESNVAAFRRHLGPDIAITAIVKALAYGTNAVFLGSFLSQAGVDYLAVSSADEGVTLRRGGVSVPILVLLLTPGEIEKAWDHRLTPVVYSHALLDAVCDGPRDDDTEAVVHLEVDTGMHRTGLDPYESIAALSRLAEEPHVRVDGLMTHLACADDPAEDDFTAGQLAEFERVVRAAHDMGLRDLVAHAAATAGAVRLPQAWKEMVRLGLGLYGIHVSRVSEPMLPLDPAVALVSRIVHCYTLREGDRVGYGGLYRAPAGGRRVAIVPVGYHDGVSRSFRGGTVLVHGEPCEVIGAISMDSMAVDITGAPEADVGSDVLFFGSYGGATVPIHDFAEMMGTIPHEVLATIGPRVQRVFSRH